MKKLIILVISFLVILTACSTQSNVQYYLNHGYTYMGSAAPSYTLDGTYSDTSTVMEKAISDSEKVSILYNQNHILVFSGTYTTGSNVVKFETRTTDEFRKCSVANSNYEQEVSCNSTYAYFLENAPNLAQEILNINTNFGLSEDAFTGGDAKEVEDVLNSFPYNI